LPTLSGKTSSAKDRAIAARLRAFCEIQREVGNSRLDELLNQAHALAPNEPEVYLLMADTLLDLALAQRGQVSAKLTGKIVEYLNKCLELSPAFHRAKHRLALVYHRLTHDNQLAWDYVQDALAHAPQEEYVELAGDIALQAHSNPGIAAEYYNRILQLQPRSHIVRFKLSRALQALGAYAECYAQLDLAARLCPRDRLFARAIEQLLDAAAKSLKRSKAALKAEFKKASSPGLDVATFTYGRDEATGFLNRAAWRLFVQQTGQSMHCTAFWLQDWQLWESELPVTAQVNLGAIVEQLRVLAPDTAVWARPLPGVMVAASGSAIAPLAGAVCQQFALAVGTSKHADLAHAYAAALNLSAGKSPSERWGMKGGNSI
jgi:tetratricopeptide (TPR) repeat protein